MKKYLLVLIISISFCGMAQVTFYKPIKVTVDSTSRHLYTYDDRGNCLREVTENLNVTWSYQKRKTYTYSISNKPLSELGELWMNNSWVYNYRILYNYNSGSSDYNKVVQLWSNNAWVDSSRDTFTFNGNGNVISQFTELSVNGRWRNYGLLSATYNDQNNFLTELYQEWSNGAWLDIFKYTWTYFTTGKLDSYTFEQRVNGVWTHQIRLRYEYDNNGFVSKVYRDDWINRSWHNSLITSYTFQDTLLTQLVSILLTDTGWVNYMKVTYTYDQAGNQTILLNEQWTSGAWVNLDKFTSTYNNYNDRVSLTYLRWVDNGWGRVYKEEFTFDDYSNATYGAYFEWHNDSWQSALGEMILYYNNKKDVIFYYCYWVYVDYTSVTEIKPGEISLSSFSLSQNYPNPFNPSTTIKFSIQKEGMVKLTLYDILGKKIADLLNENKPAGTYSVIFNAKDLPSGVYIYKLESGNYSSAKKFILLK